MSSHGRKQPLKQKHVQCIGSIDFLENKPEQQDSSTDLAPTVFGKQSTSLFCVVSLN